MQNNHRSHRFWLLLLPYLGLLWVPFYNGTDPALFGFPFFYWYQLLWVPITVAPDLARLPDGMRHED